MKNEINVMLDDQYVVIVQAESVVCGKGWRMLSFYKGGKDQCVTTRYNCGTHSFNNVRKDHGWIKPAGGYQSGSDP